jgi:hypothetical protein
MTLSSVMAFVWICRTAPILMQERSRQNSLARPVSRFSVEREDLLRLENLLSAPHILAGSRCEPIAGRESIGDTVTASMKCRSPGRSIVSREDVVSRVLLGCPDRTHRNEKKRANIPDSRRAITGFQGQRGAQFVQRKLVHSLVEAAPRWTRVGWARLWKCWVVAGLVDCVGGWRERRTKENKVSSDVLWERPSCYLLILCLGKRRLQSEIKSLQS